MIEPIMNINDIPKKVMDSATIGHNANLFLVVFTTGNENHGFALLPEGAKAFYQNLGNHIVEYEKTVRPINTAGLAPEIVSPFQKQ